MRSDFKRIDYKRYFLRCIAQMRHTAAHVVPTVVCLCVTHSGGPYENGWIDLEPVWRSRRSRNLVVDAVQIALHEEGHF